MKNKKFSQWLHRLPVLCLALILAVLPLTMAAPAHADVLTGAEYSYVQMPFGICYLPGVYESVAFCTNQIDGVLYAQCFYSSSPIGFTVNDRNLPVVYSPSWDVIYGAKVMITPSTDVVDFRSVEFEASAFGWSVENYFLILGSSNTVDFPQTVEVSVGSSSGVLDTFSGVGSWLSGAVQNISTMFWTAESGISVLGYLAVASLALAVILLIFSLIAGWLKFH